MALADEVMAVRTSVTVADGEHLAAVRVSGRDAHELLDRVSPRQLFVRSGQMLHTLFLDDAAKPIADVYVCCDEDDYLVIAEGLDGQALAAYLRSQRDGLDVQLDDRASTHAFVCVDGPYAWELIAEVTSPDVIGVPYLSFFHDARFTCFRAGKAGEYGYDLLVPREHLSSVRERLLDAGQAFDVQVASRDALDTCALEAGFFNVRHEVRDGLTPVELQLQWRVTAGRAHPGHETLARRRGAVVQRVAMIAAPSALPTDGVLELGGVRVGRILHTRWSYVRDEQIALALLDVGVSYAGLRGFHCGETPVRTISAPTVNNRSLYVDPQRHSWARRASVSFPALTRPIT